MRTNIPDLILIKWQNIANLLSEIINIPAALIMKYDQEFMEVLITSNTDNNPYKVGDSEKWQGLYCETVIKSQNNLLIPNALKDKNWNKNPDIKLGMIAYLGFPINYPENKPFGTICVLDSKENNFTEVNKKLLLQFRDVIESDLKQLQLSGDELRVRAILDHHYQLTGLLDPEGRLITANKTALEFVRLAESDVLGQYFWDCPWWEESQKADLRLQFEKAVKGEFAKFETTHKNYKGEIRNVDFSFSPVHDANNEVVYVVPEGRDITEHKQAIIKLIENEKKFRTLFESANDGISIFQGNKIIECNSKSVSLFGYDDKNELIGLSLKDLSPEKQADGSYTKVKGEEYIKAVIEGTPQRFNWRHKRKDNSKFDAEVSLNRIIIDEKVHIQAILRDRTEQIIAEKALHSSEEKFSKVFHNNPLPISITTIPEGQYIDVNPMFEKISGFSKEEVIGNTIHKLGLYSNSDDHGKLIQELQSKGKLTDYKVTFETKAGEYHDCRLFSEVVEINNENYLLSMVYDDTDRKRAEIAEIESRKRYKELLEMLPEAVFEADIDMNITYVNQRAIDLFGYSNEDLNNGINGLNMIAPESSGMAKKYFSMRSKGVEPGAVEYQAIKKDGTIFPMLIHAASIIQNGKMAGILGIIVDISQRKNAENILLENEKKYRTLFESANDGILILKDGKIVECNSKCLSIFGFDNKQDLIGLAPSDLSPEKQPDGRLTTAHEKQNLSKVIKGKPQKFNWRHFRKGGQLFDAEVSLNPILLDDKQHIQAIIRDITDRVQAEEKLKESEARFKRLFEDLGDAVYVTILGGKNIGQILEANPAAIKQTGYSKSELLNMNIINDLYVSDSGNLNSHEWEDKIIDEEVFTSVESKRKKDGTEYWTEVLITPIFYKGQKACLSINRDITKRINTEKDLKLALQKAKESDKLKTAFLESMSHEIRTPLNAIIGFSNLIADSSNDPELTKFSSLINYQNDLLLKLINDILEYASVESGTLKIKYEVFDLNNLIHDLHILYLHEQKHNLVLIPMQMPEPLIINSDQHRIKQIFTNLIINALKFTQNGSISFGYEINDRSEIVCFVKDTGIGIPKDQQESVFERFVKLDNFSQGTGLGLSIAKNIIGLIGEKLWVESEPGIGSTFFFTINRNVDEKKTEKVEPLDIITNSKDEILKEGKISTVLVAEDDTANFLYVKKLLESPNIKIIHASDGKKAVEHIKMNEKIDLILMDIKMPVLNGYEATQQIKKIKPQLPIIALTAYALSEDKMKAKNAGCNDYVSKPINKTKLFALINKYL